MTRRVSAYLTGTAVLLALAGCGRSFLQFGERPAWRHDAEVACLKSGAVKIGPGVEQMQPIEGPGMCGADFPLKVSLLGEGQAMSYAGNLRPPAAIPDDEDDQPQWPPLEQHYAPPATVPGERLRWVPGPPPAVRPQADAPAPGEPAPYEPPAEQQTAPAGQPLSIYAPGVSPPDDIPDDATLPGRPVPSAPRTQPAYNAPVYQPPPQHVPPTLGPTRGPYSQAPITPATLAPAATLACPMVSALDRWVSQGVQPAALHWFGTQVTEIQQIGSYACREMIGSGTSHMSEHAFGDALDIAGFTLADGRKISVKNGWHGTPEEQGFLHDVQLYACETFSTVLAPGYNIYHYDHIHVDLMRRRPGYHPCRPEAIPGEVVAARARAVYAAKHGAPAYTGSVTRASKLPEAIPGEDGYVADDNDVTGSVGASHLNQGVDHEFAVDTPRALSTHRAPGSAAGDAAIRAEETRDKAF